MINLRLTQANESLREARALIGQAAGTPATAPITMKITPIGSMGSNFAASQILVANQFDPQLLDQIPHAGTD